MTRFTLHDGAADRNPGAEEPALLVGVVTVRDTVRHVAVHPRATGLAARLADYAREQAPWRLLPEGARRVYQYVREGRADAAVALYFESVGHGPDAERLTIRRLGPSGLSAGAIPFPGAPCRR